MCNFLSAVVMRNGDIVCDPEHTDSHEYLLASANIRDGIAQQGQFARVEFLPPENNEDIFDLSKWALNVDELCKPDWFDEERVRSSLADRVNRMFIQGSRPFILGGCWILGSGAEVNKVVNARIWRMVGDAQVSEMWDRSLVNKMLNSSQVNVMLDSSQVNMMRDRSLVDRMLNRSQVNRMWGSSLVNKMLDSSRVNEMLNSSQVNEMLERSQVNKMYHKSIVIENRSSVGILKDYRGK